MFCFVPSTVERDSQTWTHFNLHIRIDAVSRLLLLALLERWRNRNTDGLSHLPQSHSWKAAEATFEPRQSGPRASAFNNTVSFNSRSLWFYKLLSYPPQPPAARLFLITSLEEFTVFSSASSQTARSPLCLVWSLSPLYPPCLGPIKLRLYFQNPVK